jgi:hypothetical protein
MKIFKIFKQFSAMIAAFHHPMEQLRNTEILFIFIRRGSRIFFSKKNSTIVFGRVAQSASGL